MTLVECRVIPARHVVNEDGEQVTTPRIIVFGYKAGDGLPHFGTFTEHDLEKSIAISADGTMRTGQQIIDDAGVTLE